MPTEKNPQDKTRIAIIGKFKLLHDEEYIARSFESLGHEVLRVNERLLTHQICGSIDDFNPDIVIWTKLMVTEAHLVRQHMEKYTSVCWVFDLYWGYEREYRLTTHPAFTADYVFTTDGGNQDRFEQAGINHRCVRQGIYKEEAILYPRTPSDKVIFVGSDNALHPGRFKQNSFVDGRFNYKRYGHRDTNEVRGLDLNKLFAESAVVIGDSVYSPHYWSNRVVETLGRGGFLIHQEVEGLKEEYPHLVTYERGNFEDLADKITYYLNHEDERVDIIQKNFEWVRDNYTMDKKCQELLNYIS